MKIFITGVAGFLGSHLADHMIALGHKVIGIDNLVGGELKNVNKDVEFHQIDCNEMEAVKNVMKGCDVVFHAACTAHDGFSFFSPYYITQNTFQISMSILSAAVQNNIKKFIYCSSMARYGNLEKIPFTEDMLCEPVTPYGIAKYSSEKVIERVCKLNNIYYVIIVPHNIIGPRQNYADPFRNVAGIMINRILQGKQPIIYGDGMHKRCFSFIDDVIYCLERVILQDDLDGEVINIGPDEEFVTINQLAEEIADIMNFNLQPIYVEERPLEVKLATCSSNKARKLLGYSTKVTLREGLEKMVRYIVNEGPKQFRYNYNIEINNEKTPITWKKKMF